MDMSKYALYKFILHALASWNLHWVEEQLVFCFFPNKFFQIALEGKRSNALYTRSLSFQPRHKATKGLQKRRGRRTITLAVGSREGWGWSRPGWVSFWWTRWPPTKATRSTRSISVSTLKFCVAYSNLLTLRQKSPWYLNFLRLLVIEQLWLVQ